MSKKLMLIAVAIFGLSTLAMADNNQPVAAEQPAVVKPAEKPVAAKAKAPKAAKKIKKGKGKKAAPVAAPLAPETK